MISNKTFIYFIILLNYINLTSPNNSNENFASKFTYHPKYFDLYETA